MSAARRSHLDAIRACVIAQGVLAEASVAAAVLAVEGRDGQWEASLAETMKRVERYAWSISEKCVCLIENGRSALEDLRRVAAFLKVNHELCEIARIAQDIATDSPAIRHLPWCGQSPLDVGGRLSQVRSLLRQCMDAMASLDTEMVRSVRDAVSRASCPDENVSRELQQAAQCHPESAPQLAAVLCASVQLGWALAHVGKIAEYVACVVSNDTRRHTQPLRAESRIPTAHDVLGEAEDGKFLMEPVAGAAPALADLPSG